LTSALMGDPSMTPLPVEEDNIGDPQPANERFRLAACPFREGVARCLACQPGGQDMDRPPRR
jgi:hypothetical protein